MAKFFIGQVAEKLDLNPKTIRYYEKNGMLRDDRRTEGGYRVFDQKAIERLEFILKAKALGSEARRDQADFGALRQGTNSARTHSGFACKKNHQKM